MTAHAVANEKFLDITITTFTSPSEPDSQRGRKRRRSPPGSLEAPASARQLPSGESAVFRGRCRYRSTSRLDMSRNVSRVRGTSLSPTRKRFLQVLQLNRHRSQSPSRSRSALHPRAQDTPKRRRQRTRSRSRKHREAANDFDEPSSILWHDYLEHGRAIRREISPTNQTQVNQI